MPFALNASTAFISPTKTLEYMAAHKPVVSTAIRDVQRLYAAGVSIGQDHAQFIAMCEHALDETDEAAQARIRTQDALTRAVSWDATVEEMTVLIRQAASRGLNPRARAYLDGGRVVALPEPPIECLILGAGRTGLSAAYHCGKGSVLVEREASVGGWCRSIDDHGFRFDHAGHIMFSNDPDVLALYETLLGNNTRGLMPPRLRELFALPWDARDARNWTRFTRLAPRVYWALPAALRHWPARYFLAQLRKRYGSERTPDSQTRRVR
ncbi:hypothetical protein CMZ84_13170 [Lysobacteraceae bacterium NML93-0399]|nr:hypothetical protein CMZ84_13170 [Xanthomonadaceae bacterium NML93-0399]